MNESLIFFMVAAVVLTAVVLVAYRSGHLDRYGSFEPSNKVEQKFKHRQLPLQYHYYYFGESPTEIFALVGLDQHYSIDDADWKTFDPEDEILESLLANMASDTIEPANGYVVIGPDRSTMGIFYTTLPEPVVQIDRQQQVVFTLDVPSSLTYGE